MKNTRLFPFSVTRLQELRIQQIQQDQQLIQLANE